MNTELEEKIIQSFICKDNRERMSYCLKSPKRRSDYLWRIDRKMFTSKNIINVPRQRMTPQNLRSFIKKHTDDGKCYVLKPSSEYDGETLSVEEAIDLFFGLGPFLLYFPEKNILYFEEEENHGAQGRYIMF